ncbi:MAG TPA: AI-2E family transporter, partial [Devosia sp.]|nr:AI-2E family transporter [Devosia sp.]
MQTQNLSTPQPVGSPLVTVAVILVVIAGLYLGAGILVPLVLAILLAFALAPLVTALEKLHVPDVLAVLLSVLLAGAVLGAFAYLATTQLMSLAADLPGYQSTVVKKIRDLQASLGGGGFLERITNSIEALGAQMDGSAANANGTRAPGEPIPVTISNNAGNPLGVISVILGSVLGPIATAAIVTIFLIFLLLGRDDLRDRFIRLVSRGNFSTTTLVIDDAAARVGRYLLVQFGVNVSYGIIFGTGLLLIGVPNAILWGLMAALFRYIPFVGTLIVASIPFALAFAVDPGWNMLVSAIALFAGLELITTNAIEPRLYGTSTGLSPLAVLLAAMFWATMWGPIGLILSTPLTVCLVVLGRYVPQLAFLETLLGSEPVLNQQERLYQRLLAGDTEEAIEISEELVEEKGTEALYTQYLLPALVQASTDLADGPASSMQRRRMATSLYALV